MSISSLGYVGFRVADPAAWTEFATGVLGLMPVESPSGARRFRADALAWRIGLEEGPEDDVAYIGFEVADAEALEAVRGRLRRAGVAVTEPEPGLVEERGVLDLFTCRDPDGLTVEVYYGPSERHEAPFVSPTGGGFVTGGQGVGHAVLTTADIAKAGVFYRDGLGLRLSDVIRMAFGPDFALELEFYHCNPRHHTLALVPLPAPKRLHHFMLQTRSLDDVGLALDRANAAGLRITQSLGRHTNDHMVSFYAETPAGFEVEFGWGAREVDASWRVVRHDRASIWGHKHAAA